MDPLAEKYPGWSGFHYSKDNPVMYVDPNGRDVMKPADNNQTAALRYAYRSSEVFRRQFDKVRDDPKQLWRFSNRSPAEGYAATSSIPTSGGDYSVVTTTAFDATKLMMADGIFPQQPRMAGILSNEVTHANEQKQIGSIDLNEIAKFTGKEVDKLSVGDITGYFYSVIIEGGSPGEVVDVGRNAKCTKSAQANQVKAEDEANRGNSRKYDDKSDEELDKIMWKVGQH